MNQIILRQIILKYISIESVHCFKVLLIDESKFNLRGSDGRQFVWRIPNTEFNNQNTKATAMNGVGSIVV